MDAVSVICLLFSVLLIPELGALPQPKGNAVRECDGHENGFIKEENGYYYKCDNGMLYPSGCLSGAKERIQIDGTFRLFNFEMRCLLTREGFMNKEYVGCIVNNQTVYPGNTAETPTVWHTCKSEKFFVELTSGCMYAGKRLNKGDSVKDETVSLECRDMDSGPAMVQIGCVSKGVEYRIGDAFEDDTAVYSCSSERNLVKRKVIGCVHNGKRLFDKDSFYDGDLIMMCQITEKGARLIATGCIHHDNGQDIGKNVGCVWIDGPYPKQFQTVCKKSDTGKVYKERVSCFYEPHAVLEPGCYRQIGDLNVGCRKTEDKSIEYVTFEVATPDKASSFGLSHC